MRCLDSTDSANVSAATQCPRRTRISSRTSGTGQEVLVVELPDDAPAVDPDGLGELLLGTTPGIPDVARGARRVSVDDAFFELTLDELVSQTTLSDTAVVLQSSSHLAGIRSLPTEDSRLAGRELRRLHEALCGQR